MIQKTESRDLPSPRWATSADLMDAQMEGGVKDKGTPSLFLSWDIHLLLPSGTGATGSWAFGLDVNDTNGFPDSPVCRWPTVGVPSFQTM